MKKCKRCKSTFELSEFYKHKEMTDGHLSFCKSCTKKRVKKHRCENVEKIKDYERGRSNLKHRVLARENYIKTDAGKSAKKRASIKWIFNNPKARRAQNMVSSAKRNGKLKEKPCHICGSKIVHAHHCDYNKPLDVMWLCPKHHKEWHLNNEPVF